nr:adaptin ear-binding coat-associated protein 1-like [Pelodiscus sinensis]|eukprot:XP_006137184.1 adaptin ear-binding coat-associated protein 1-like [Pelodiscus sinensis]
MSEGLIVFLEQNGVNCDYSVVSFSKLFIYPSRASDWKLDQPDWTGRLRVTSKGKIAYIKLEDKVSGELFAQAPIDQFPGIAVETVTDSSRYFVIRIQDGNGE